MGVVYLFEQYQRDSYERADALEWHRKKVADDPTWDFFGFPARDWN